MDLKESSLEGDSRFYPFTKSIADPLCKLNLKETSEFVKAFPVNPSTKSSESTSRRMGTLSTPGRPLFSFSVGNLSRKSIPSKWVDAEKWLISGSCHESPAHVTKISDPSRICRHNDVLHQKGDAFSEIVRVDEEKVSAFDGLSSETVLQDKFTDNSVELPCPNFRFTDPTKESFLFRGPYSEKTAEAASKIQNRDIGTETTPLGSGMTSRCHTPIKNSSPPRHNTPLDMSGPLVASNSTFNISELKDCHFAKLQLSAQYDSMFSNWSSREEEEKDVSKSLRHLDETRASVWEDEERTKICIRYQMEEAKIQAWVNLQNAKAEAKSSKLEVKIQKMRSNLEEKLMKRMAIVHRRVEDWRAEAQLNHSQQILRASEHAQKMKLHQNPQISCGCLPCSNHL